MDERYLFFLQYYLTMLKQVLMALSLSRFAFLSISFSFSGQCCSTLFVHIGPMVVCVCTVHARLSSPFTLAYKRFAKHSLTRSNQTVSMQLACFVCVSVYASNTIWVWRFRFNFMFILYFSGCQQCSDVNNMNFVAFDNTRLHLCSFILFIFAHFQTKILSFTFVKLKIPIEQQRHAILSAF